MNDDQTCRMCGAVRNPADPASLAWSSERDEGDRQRLLCPNCTRRHARDIETGLPAEYW